MKTFACFILLYFLFFEYTNSAKILVLHVHDERSHLFSMAPFLKRLTEEGHELTIFDSCSDPKPAKLGFNSSMIHAYLPPNLDFEDKLSKVLWFHDVHSFIPAINHKFGDNNMGELILHAAEKFVEIFKNDYNLVIVDEVFSIHGMTIAKILKELKDIPYISFTTANIALESNMAELALENHCTDNLMFTVNANLRSQTNDKIVMLRNGKIIWTFYGNDGNTSLSTGGPGSDIYEIDFTSLSSSDDIVTEGGWWWNFIIYTMPAVPKLLYNLNDAAPTLHFQLSQLLSGQEISVTVDPNKDLEMFIVGNDLENLTNFIFYESLDHSQFIGSFANKSLFIYNGSTLYAAKYLPKSKVLTVQNTLGQGPYSYSVVYFRIAQSVNVDCTNNNVYSLPSTNAMLAFSYNPSAICKYSIVVYGYSLAIDIDQVYSNSSDLVQVIGENYNQTVKYFRFNDATAEDWKNLQFHATVLNFIVPKNTQATILYGNQWIRQYYNGTQVNSFINQSNIVTSPGYGGLYFDHLSDFFVTQIQSTYKQSSFLLSVINQNVSFSGALTLEGYGPSSIDLKTIKQQPLWLLTFGW